MRCLSLFFPQALCETWSAFFAAIVSPTIKNISMIECFNVFSEGIAFVGIGWQFAAVRTSFPSQGWIGVDAASARANEVGAASIARFVPPTSQRRVAEAQEWSVPPRRPEWLPGGRPTRPVGGEPSPQPAPRQRLGEPLHCGLEGSCQQADPLLAALVSSNRLFAGFLLQRVRPRDHASAEPKRRIGSSRDLNHGAISMPVPDGRSALAQESAQTASASLPPAQIETLLVELVRRRLSSLAAKERAQ